MSKAKVIGKIVLSTEQCDELSRLGLSASDIATDDPKSRNDSEEIIKRIGDAEAIIVNISTNITQKVIERCKSLKFIQTWSTGMDNIDRDAAKKAGIIVKNVPDFSTDSVAEKTFGMMILIANRIGEANKDALEGHWRYKVFQGVELKGKTLCIIGTGKIGSRVAELARAFGMNVLLINSKTSREELRKALSVSDFITLHCPLNASTYHLLGEQEFNAVKKGAYLVNNSRGGVVDEDCLLHALNDGTIKYASIDVFEKEPPEKTNPLVVHPNVFVTPHIAWHTKEAAARLTDYSIHNLKEYLLSEKSKINQEELASL